MTRLFDFNHPIIIFIGHFLGWILDIDRSQV